MDPATERSNTPPAAPQAPPPGAIVEPAPPGLIEPPPPGLIAGLWRNLTGGLALVALQRRWPPRFAVSFDQLAALLLVNLTVWAALDKLHAGRSAEFGAEGLLGGAGYLLLAFIACALVARAQNRAAPTRALTVTVLAVSPWVLTLVWLAGDVPWIAVRPLLTLLWVAGFVPWIGAGPLLMTLAALVWLAVLAVRVLGAAFGPVRLAPALIAIVLVLATPGALGWLDLDTRLWVPPETEAAQEDDDPAMAEALLYDQPARIAAVVARVTPSQPGAPRAYFVGFAGDADPEVFSREAQFARQAFAARFGSADRSVLLVNDAGDRDSWPLASLSGLGQALRLLATRMDPEQDVLVLYLTSHGSQDGLEVRNGTLPLAQIDPEDLRQALDESGIRWRVVVVSACYAGVFVDALKNQTTAVVTASDAAHSSFGCQADRDLTWFGEAFLKDSLPESDSLEQAFAKATRLVAQREDSEHEAHSNPQLFVGALMRHKLRELESSHPTAAGSPVIVRR